MWVSLRIFMLLVAVCFSGCFSPVTEGPGATSTPALSHSGPCASWCTGCCTREGDCIAEMQWAGACGASGVTCGRCAGHQDCFDGACRDVSCTGCVDVTGRCQTTFDAGCGAQGASCRVGCK